MKHVSTRTLLRRLNRKLAHDSQVIKTCRKTSRWYETWGDYYIIDVGFNSLVDTHVDIEHLGRETGCLADDEILVWPDEV